MTANNGSARQRQREQREKREAKQADKSRTMADKVRTRQARAGGDGEPREDYERGGGAGKGGRPSRPTWCTRAVGVTRCATGPPSTSHRASPRCLPRTRLISTAAASVLPPGGQQSTRPVGTELASGRGQGDNPCQAERGV